LEVLIGLSFLAVLISMAYALMSQSGKTSRGKMDRVSSLGAARRVTGFLNQYLKVSSKVLHPSEGQPRGSSYCLLKGEDGTLSQLYFSEAGDFMIRGFSEGNKSPKMLVRSPNKRIGVRNPLWFLRPGGVLEFYIAYKENTGNEENIVEIFDSYALSR